MADDKGKTDGRDRSRIAAGQDYEVQYFAERYGISMEQARELISSMATIARSSSSRSPRLKG